jgi:hypothetical protein
LQGHRKLQTGNCKLAERPFTLAWRQAGFKFYILMRKLIPVLLFIPLLAFKCSDKKSSKCIIGKVVRTSCASFIVQALNADTLGVDGWKDSVATNETYDNVFNVSNRCHIPAELKAGDTIAFTIGANKQDDCMVCMMFDAPPEAKYAISMCE